MATKHKLTATMSIEQFDNGYWYAQELKSFATGLGIPAASKLRKDELEKAITHYLRTGKIKMAPRPSTAKHTVRDIEKGLHPALPVVAYTNDKQTKKFLFTEAKKMDPEFRVQSGTRYPLNRWREEQIAQGKKITYGDLIRQFVTLNQGPREPLRRPHGRYNNFVADFMKANPGKDRKQMIKAWEELKNIDAPKTYENWASRQRRRSSS